jgi:hypothetical protein
MKKLLMLLPLLLVGCMHVVIPTDNARVVSVATGTNGSVDYSCSQLDSPAHQNDIDFRCQFHNITDQRQPGPAVHLALYLEKTSKLVVVSRPIYALPTDPGQTDVKHYYLNRYIASPLCGYNLDRCVVLVEKDKR